MSRTHRYAPAAAICLILFSVSGPRAEERPTAAAGPRSTRPIGSDELPPPVRLPGFRSERNVSVPDRPCYRRTIATRKPGITLVPIFGRLFCRNKPAKGDSAPTEDVSHRFDRLAGDPNDRSTETAPAEPSEPVADSADSEEDWVLPPEAEPIATFADAQAESNALPPIGPGALAPQARITRVDPPEPARIERRIPRATDPDRSAVCLMLLARGRRQLGSGGILAARHTLTTAQLLEAELGPRDYTPSDLWAAICRDRWSNRP